MNKWLAAPNANTGAVRSYPAFGVVTEAAGSNRGDALRTTGGIPVRRGKTKRQPTGGTAGRGVNADLFDYRLHDKGYYVKAEYLTDEFLKPLER
jgi:hypothetical protein